MEEFGGFAFEGMADELEYPSEDEERGGVNPEAMEEESGDGYRERNQNCRDAQRVAGPIDRMLVAGRVVRDPLVGGAVTEHRGDDTPSAGLKPDSFGYVGRGAEAPLFHLLNLDLPVRLRSSTR
jgi:hypothetical protein